MESLESHSSDSDSPRKPAFSWRTLTAHRGTTLPFIRTLNRLHSVMRPGTRLLLYIFSTLLAMSTIGLALTLAHTVMVESPVQGGSLHEGIVGTPRFINPLLASSDADRDLTMLIYSGLMRAMPDGSLIPDIASSYTISDDGTVYTFTLRDGVTFQDNTPITSADVAFTIALAQNPDIKSVKRANWEGVTVETPDERTVVFTLARSYAPFLENTTLGILPKHLWSEVGSDAFSFHQLNTQPIGSGPYMLSHIKSDKSGTPTEYVLSAFSHFALGAPYLKTITLKFYGDEDAQVVAYASGIIDSMPGITANKASKISTQGVLQTVPLPRVFAVFLNQNQAPVLLNTAVRAALNTALDKQMVIDVALDGYGTPLEGPIPPLVMKEGTDSPAASSGTEEERIAEAQEILEDAGWTRDEETGWYEKKDTELAFSLSTADTPELVASANEIARQWQALGANVTVKVFAAGSVNTNVIRPRNYDALLFGEVVGRTLDLFAFWHSSQRSDPGLNLALYTNANADTLLSNARAETDRGLREEDYTKFIKLVTNDQPAVFLYAPDFLYYFPANLKGVALGALSSASDRFLNVYQWHVETKELWPIFSN